jgi:hypothetical protein
MQPLHGSHSLFRHHNSGATAHPRGNTTAGHFTQWIMCISNSSLAQGIHLWSCWISLPLIAILPPAHNRVLVPCVNCVNMGLRSCMWLVHGSEVWKLWNGIAIVLQLLVAVFIYKVYAYGYWNKDTVMGLWQDHDQWRMMKGSRADLNQEREREI